MKKLLAVLLCAALMTACAAALAEEGTLQPFGTIDANGLYALTGKLPDGYTFDIETAETGLLHGSLRNPDTTKPILAFTVIFDETYAEVERLNDLGAEDLAFLESTFEDPEKQVSYTETAHGTKLMCVSTQVGGWEYFTILTIYKGYLVEINMFAGEGSGGTLTEEQKKIAVDFLSHMNFEGMTAVPKAE